MLSNNNNIFTCRVNNGISSIIGNEVCVIRDFYKSLYPNNFFKDYWIDTRWFSNEIEKKDVTRQSKPMLAIKPRPNIGLEASYFTRFPNYFYGTYFLFRNLREHYCPIVIDEEQGFYLYCLPDRVKVDYEINLKTSTRMDMLNMAWHLKGSVLHGSYFYINDTYMESEIPRKYILALAHKMNFDLNNPKDTDDFEEYLNYKSKGKITKKKKLSSGNYEYFYQYRVDILCLIEQDPDLGDGEGNNMTEDNFIVTSNIQTEFYCPFNFFLEIEDKTNKTQEFLLEYDKDNIIKKVDGTMELMQNVDENVSVNLSFPLSEVMHKEDAIKIDGKQLTIWQGYLTEGETIDELDFEDALSHEMLEVIKYNNSKDIDNSNEFVIKVYKDKELIADRYIEINWKRFMLKNFTPEENTTFYLAIYCDLPSIRKKAETIRNDRNKLIN